MEGSQSSTMCLNASGPRCSLRWTAIASAYSAAQNATTIAAHGSANRPTRSPGRQPQSRHRAARARLRWSSSANVRLSCANPSASLSGNRPAMSCSRSCNSIGSGDRASLCQVVRHRIQRGEVLRHEVVSIDGDAERLLQPHDQVHHRQAVEDPIAHEVLGGIELQLRAGIQLGSYVLKDALLRGHACLPNSKDGTKAESIRRHPTKHCSHASSRKRNTVVSPCTTTSTGSKARSDRFCRSPST